jgi:tetratricopeptide (TPR) repeat protein
MRRRELDMSRRPSANPSAAPHAKVVSFAKVRLPLIPVTLAFAVYLPSLFSEFILDDHGQIVTNPQVQSWGNLPRLLTTNLWSQRVGEDLGHYYRPLFSVYMLLIDTFGGLTPWFWHVSSILLHVACTYFVFLFCRELLEMDRAASFAAILFALHPIHVDAVSWVSASDEILFTLFLLGALLFLLFGWRAGFPEPKFIVLSVFFYAAAMFTKETAIALLPLFLFLPLSMKKVELRVSQSHRLNLRSGLLYLLPVAGYLCVRWLVLRSMGLETGVHDWRQVLYTSPSILTFYLKKLIWPVHLSAFYTNTLISSPTRALWIPLFVVVLIISVFIWIAMRRSRIIALAAALVFLPLVPVLGGIRVYDQGNMTHDRYLYLPSIGLCLLFGLVSKAALSKPLTTRRSFITIAVLLAIILGYLTMGQQKFYAADAVCYQRAIDINSDNTLVRDNLGNVYLNHGDNELALMQFQTAVQLAPDDPNARFFLARGFFETKDYEAARVLLGELAGSNSLRPKRRAKVYLTLAEIDIIRGELDGASNWLNELEKLDPNYPALHRTNATLLQRQGRLREAQAEYAKEFEISGDAAAGQQALALLRVLSSDRTGNAELRK